MKLFVWDFHGVLEKDNEYAVQHVVNQVLKEFGIDKHVKIDEIRELYGLRFIEYYQTLLPEASEEYISKMLKRSVEISRKVTSRYIKPVAHSHKVLDEIVRSGNRNIVISNCSSESIEFFLDSVRIKSFMYDYFGVDDYKFGMLESKPDLLRSYIKRGNFDKVVIVGDTEQDIEAGLSCNAITYLFKRKDKESKGRLLDTKAHYVISDLREVLREL